MATLLIDNYDSFTFNLYQLLAEVRGECPEVVRNDEIELAEIVARGYDSIVISPGPGSVTNPVDFGVNRDVLTQSSIPVLGVCLGFQGLCHAYGASIDYAPEIMHGRLSRVYHKGSYVFRDIPSPFDAVRYHSLVARHLPKCLELLAWTDDDIAMGVRHLDLPFYGVQFHPESICTEFGQQIVRNFLGQTLPDRYRPTTIHSATMHSATTRPTAVRNDGPHVRDRGDQAVKWRRLQFYPECEWAFTRLFSDSEVAFWLDSSKVVPGLSQFSFMGGYQVDECEYISYRLDEELVLSHYGTEAGYDVDVFDYLSQQLSDGRVEDLGLPFPFVGGYVGWLGYELKSKCDRSVKSKYSAHTPDAMLIRADRFIAFDHLKRQAFLVSVGDQSEAESWFDETERALRNLTPPSNGWSNKRTAPDLPFSLRHDPSEYVALIQECLDEIREGNSYEVCLTNQASAYVDIDPLDCYRFLRSQNPAPYAAFLKVPGVAVLSSSPERFLSIDQHGNVESKPIKGTCARGTTKKSDDETKLRLANSEKDRAENLMIVDLVRNDLANVCKVSSVHVPKLFDIESYATVHQMVSTVRGKLAEGKTAIDCIKASFPPGSMTGAPKIRTMEIIDRLERGPRGIYSGALGYFSFDGATDLSVVIRTIVATEDKLTWGIGGAIVALSDPDDEFEETILKGSALNKAINRSLASLKSASHSRHDGVAKHKVAAKVSPDG